MTSFRCSKGYHQHPPKSQKCKRNTRRKCKNGWQRNSQTNRCRKHVVSRKSFFQNLKQFSPVLASAVKPTV